MRKWWGYTTTCKWLLWLGLVSSPALGAETIDTVLYWRQHQLWPAHDLVSLKPVTPRRQADGERFPLLQVFSLERLHFLTLNPRLDLRYQPAPHGKALSVSLSADPVLPADGQEGLSVSETAVPQKHKDALVALAASQGEHGIVARVVSGWVSLPVSASPDSVFLPHAWLEYWHHSAGWQRLDPGLSLLSAEVSEPGTVSVLSAAVDRVWLIVLAGLLLVFWRWCFQQGRPADRNPRAAWLYLAFCRRMQQHGLARSAAETPSAYYRRLKDSHPGFAPGLHAVTAAYLRAAYGLHFTRQQRQRRNRLLYLAIRRLDWRQLPQSPSELLSGESATDAG